MSPKHTLSLSILAAALAAGSSGALAADPTGSPSRAEVKASVLQARANGQLTPAGEASQPFMTPAGASMLSHRQVRDETLQARAHGQLVPAGEGSPSVAETGTQMARADVKEATRQARMNNELDSRRRRHRPGRDPGPRAGEAHRALCLEALSDAAHRTQVGGRPREAPAAPACLKTPRRRARGRPHNPSSASNARKRNRHEDCPPHRARRRPDARRPFRRHRGPGPGDDASPRQRLRRERHLRAAPAEVDRPVQRRGQGHAADQLHRRAEGDSHLRGRQRGQVRRGRHGAVDRRVLHERDARVRLPEADADPGGRAAQERRLRGDQRALDEEGQHGLPGADGREPAVPPLPQQEDRQARRSPA